MSKENNTKKLREEIAGLKSQLKDSQERLKDSQERLRIALDDQSELAGKTTETNKTILKQLKEIDRHANAQRAAIKSLRATIPRESR
jgi:hypothetical protein